MKDFIEITVEYLAAAVELFSSLIILLASVTALIGYVKSYVFQKGPVIPRVEIRLSLGRSLALALELLLGADILKTAVAPTWNEIGQLAAIAAIRTILNYFLERELSNVDPTVETKNQRN